MVSYLTLLLICLACWYVSFAMSGYELLSPSSIIFLGFSISLVLAIVGTFSWNTYVLSEQVVAIVVVGFAGVVAASFVANSIKFRNSKSQRRLSNGIKPYRTPTWKYALVFGVVLFAIALRVYETRKLGVQLGFNISDYSELTKNLRNAMSTLFTTEAIKGGISFSFVERQLEKIVYMTGFASAVLAAKSFYESDKRGLVWAALLFIGCCVFQIAAGGRGMIFYYIIALFVAYSFFLYHGRKQSEKRSLSVKIVVFGCFAAIACALFMYFAGALVGRATSKSFVDYVSFYFGGSIPSLQIMVDSNYENVTRGDGAVNAFYYIHLFFYKLDVLKELPTYSMTWVTCGTFNSNIFTCFGRYYVDFDYFGVFALSFLSTAFMGVVYIYGRDRMSPISIVLASYLCSYAFDCAREEFIFSRLLGTTQLVDVILLVLIALFLTRPLIIREPNRSFASFFIKGKQDEVKRFLSLVPSLKVWG